MAEEPKKIFKYVSLSELVALSIGFLYFTGYYINSIFIRNLGIVRSELFKLEYIAIGIAFGLAAVGFTIVPISIFYFVFRVREASGLPHYRIGAIGNSLNTATCLMFALFLALFVTKYEWDSTVHIALFGPAWFGSIAILCLSLSLIGMAVLPYFERVINRVGTEKKKQKLFRYVVEPLRFGIFVLSISFILYLLFQINWFADLIVRAIYFLLAGFVFVGGIIGASLWIQNIGSFRAKWLIYCLIGFGVTSLYYMSVTSYVFGVYNYVPYNRGGRLPLTQAFIKMSDEKKILFSSEFDLNSELYQGPLYIIEENEDSLFVAAKEMDHWFDSFVPVHVVRKEDIIHIRLERIENGFPRSR